jgi:hypothetical protein
MDYPSHSQTGTFKTTFSIAGHRLVNWALTRRIIDLTQIPSLCKSVYRYDIEELVIENMLTITVVLPVRHSVSVTKPVESVLDVIKRLEDVILPTRMC